MKIAVVGAGVSGLVSALLLDERHEVSLFEAGSYPGGHTNTVEVETETGPLAVDTGFIVYNDRNYPNFEALLARLGVAGQPSNMSFSVSDPSGSFEYAATSLNGLYADRANLISPAFQRMILEVPRFQRVLRAVLAGESGSADLTLVELLARERFSDFFVHRLILPQVAAVWSADPAALERFPARFLATFFANHGMLSLRGRPAWRTVRGGSRSYVEAICRTRRGPLHLDARVASVERVGEGVRVTVAGRPAEIFDHVVLATHSDQALALLGSGASAAEREILGAIPYSANEAILHTDVRLLPRRRRAWASWNYHLLGPERSAGAAVTYHMNRLQSLVGEREYCVTLNRREAIDPEAIIAAFPYAHPIFTPDSVAAQSRVAEISGADRIHFCGAYWGWGFHEDGVVSAQRVAGYFGEQL